MELSRGNKYYTKNSQIKIEADDQLCGEVFFTVNRTLTFRCCVCGKNFGSYDDFLEHLSNQHYEDLQEVIEVDIESREGNIDSLLDDYCLDDEVLKEFHESVKDEYVEDVYGNEESMQNVETVDYKPVVEKIEEVLIEEPPIFNRYSYEDDFDDLSNMEQKFSPKPQDEADSYIKQFRRSRKKYTEPFICKLCGKIFKTNPKLRRHLITHSDRRDHECEICGFAFKERSNLDAHRRRHLGQKNVSCNYCSKKFYTSTEARNHQRTHTGERPYVCAMCGLSFASAGGLNTHNKKHISDPTHRCEYCDKGFYSKQDLADHVVVHTKEKAFACTICSARFPRMKALIRHSKLHQKPNTETYP